MFFGSDIYSSQCTKCTEQEVFLHLDLKLLLVLMSSQMPSVTEINDVISIRQ